MTLKDCIDGTELVPSCLFKRVKINPVANYLWFQIYSVEHGKLSDAVALHGKDVTEK